MHTTPRDTALAIIYALTIFVSAFLLFQVQPLVSKRILPWYGGTPAVWTTCMLFFQVLLFAGYAYAHATARFLRPRQQAALHLSVLVTAVLLVLLLGVLPSNSWMPTDTHHPVRDILILLAASIGLPYFILATTGPLIQDWFARSFPGRSPYRLYALSNVGSLLALLSYPFFFERVLDLPQQARIWAAGFAAFVALCGYAAVRLRRSCRDGGESDATSTETPPSVSIETVAAPKVSQCIAWLIAPMFASITLLATTNYVCADIAVVPFLWVVPLALYLVTFIIAFDHPRWYQRVPTAIFTMLAIYGVVIVKGNGMGEINVYSDLGILGAFIQSIHEPIAIRLAEKALPPDSAVVYVDFMGFLGLNFAAMFGMCMLCHGELFRQRPHPKYLTFYFLMIAAGGALGGVAVSLIAPQVFQTYFEWELSIGLGCLFAAGLLLWTVFGFAFSHSGWSLTKRLLVFGAIGSIVLVPGSVQMMDLVNFLQPNDSNIKLSSRNFFGALTVRERDKGDPKRHAITLLHGAIPHGSQCVAPTLREKPIAYYGRTTGIAHTMDYYRASQPSGRLRVGVVGLGTGTMAAHARSGDSLSFYEIDPAVIDIAESGRWFTYLQDATNRGATYEIKLGDARLTMARELADNELQRYDVLMLDAFSGDAIPAHLLTEEAFAIYLEHLTTGEGGIPAGALVVHISNRYVDLEPVVRAMAQRFKLRMAKIVNDHDSTEFISAATYIVLSHNATLMDALEPLAEPAVNPAKKPAVLWTDFRSNLFDVMKTRRRD